MEGLVLFNWFVYVEGAQPGDVLKVTLHKVELGDWGWNAIIPGLGFLADTLKSKYIRTYEFDKSMTSVKFDDKITIPLKPFPGADDYAYFKGGVGA